MYKNLLNTNLGIIEYRIFGKGIPVLVVHGGHSNCYEDLGVNFFDTSKYRIIIPSRPGYGSTPIGDNKTPEKTAGLIVELLDYLEFEKVVVYGISAGGLTALALSALYPEKVSQLILASAVTKQWLNKKGRVYKLGKKIFNPKIEWLTWSLVRLFTALFPRNIAKQFHEQFSTLPTHPIRKKDIDVLIDALRNYRSGEGFVNDIEQTLDHELLRQIQCPTLIVHSKHDNSVPYEHAIYAKNLIRNAVFLGVENEWGHIIWIGSGALKVVTFITDFMEEYRLKENHLQIK